MEGNIEKEIKDKLSQKHAYVLITCDSPSKNGDMNVEMSYEGDPVLAAYMLQGAQSYFEERENDQDETNNSKK